MCSRAVILLLLVSCFDVYIVQGTVSSLGFVKGFAFVWLFVSFLKRALCLPLHELYSYLHAYVGFFVYICVLFFSIQCHVIFDSGISKLRTFITAK